MKWAWFLLFFSATLAAQTVTVAVIDTGFDLDNQALRPRLKLGETDEEGAIALPGFAGWNFTNNEHLKASLIDGVALQEVLFYRTLKAKSHQQGLAESEREWLERKKADPLFKEQLRRFKQQAHGTMVTGILLAEGEGIEVFPVRGLGIDVPTLVVDDTTQAQLSPIQRHSEAEFRRQLSLSEERIIRKLRKMLAWIHLHNIRVVNASYGVTEKHIRRRFAEWHKEITGLELDEIKLKEIVDSYFASIYQRADRILARYPNTLFIFSAGNSAQNNDVSHHFPSRIRRPHVISVAALNGEYLASFSNWGESTVDVAAPGVGVMSVIPTVYAQQTGLSQTPASGTSMAAPHVANLAARCLQLNKELTGAELKRILLETGDEFISLIGKTVSGRAVNPERALKAARLSLELPLEEAIRLALSPLTASSASSSTPDPVTETPDTSVPPAPATPSAPPIAPALPTSPSP
jgi:subtilisin family serine protease